MSTKYSIRPAPRKRPWICKRSPPCLIPDPFPPSLICTFYLRRRTPAPQGLPAQGSYLLIWEPGPKYYHGIWYGLHETFDCVFETNRTTGQSRASATWSIDGYTDGGTFHGDQATTHPHLYYTSSVVYAGFFDWLTKLAITG